MFNDLSGHAGLELLPRPPASKRGSMAFVELITTAALALSTAVAVTAVSIGIARADVAGSAAHEDATAFAVTLLVGFLLSGMSSAIMAAGHRRHERAR